MDFHQSQEHGAWVTVNGHWWGGKGLGESINVSSTSMPFTQVPCPEGRQSVNQMALRSSRSQSDSKALRGLLRFLFSPFMD